MCGILGIVSRSPVVERLLLGLKRLEYRGYDSAGLVLEDELGCFFRQRVCGKIQALSESINIDSHTQCMGISHTRWATHGKPNQENAHPHQYKQSMAMVHNGIIENAQSLLKNYNYAYESETDTERFLVYFAWLYEQKKNDIPATIDAVFENCIGQYAALIVFKDKPNHILGLAKDSALILGIGKEGDYYVSSDVFAIESWITGFVVIESGHYVCVNETGYAIYNAKHKRVQPIIQTLDTPVYLDKTHQYAHYMEKEILEQAAVIQHLSNWVAPKNTLRVNAFSSVFQKRLLLCRRIFIIACGSSYHAGCFIKCELERLLNVAVEVVFSSQFNDAPSRIDENSLCIFISQSGETADTLLAVRHCCALEKTPLMLGITNVKESALVRLVDETLLMQTGKEIGVAATKTFLAQLFLLLFCAHAFSSIRQQLSTETQRVYFAFLRQGWSDLNNTHVWRENIKSWAKYMVSRRYILLLARANLYPIILEGALKIKEITYIPTEAYLAGELKHGSLALVEKGVPALCLVDQNNALKMLANMREIESRGACVYSIHDAALNINSNNYHRCIALKLTHPYSMNFCSTVLLQWLAYECSVLLNLNPDQPRNLAKSVTVG